MRLLNEKEAQLKWNGDGRGARRGRDDDGTMFLAHLSSPRWGDGSEALRPSSNNRIQNFQHFETAYINRVTLY